MPAPTWLLLLLLGLAAHAADSDATNVTLFRGLLALEPHGCRARGYLDLRASRTNSTWRERAVRRVLDPLVGRDALSPAQQAHYTNVSEYMTWGPARNVSGLHVHVGGLNRVVPATDDDGNTRLDLRMPVHCKAAWVDVKNPNLGLAARVQVVSDRGWSIVSDIDDTMRLTHVLTPVKALYNTLVEPFVPVPGMPDFVARLRAAVPSPSLHYVSGTPNFLTVPLTAWFNKLGIPGTLFLSKHDPTDLDFWRDGTREHKLREVRALIAMFPHRKFVFIGDSGELDPEIYGTVYRTHALAPKAPQKSGNGDLTIMPEPQADIACIFIRKVVGDNPTKEAQKNAPERFAEAFKGVPRNKWATFEHPSEIWNRINLVNGKCY